MKIAVIIVRVLMGLMFLFASIAYFFKLIPPQELSGPMKLFNEGLVASGYFMQFLKAVELIAGLLLVAGLFLPLTAIIIFPITINIFMVHVFLAPQGIPIAIFMLAGNLFLAWYYRKSYATLFIMK
ncbi:DoxX family membrane protein [Dyadobacter sp. 3J3]|uniref:DoxX family membrane protein n=1 Tax=Dyadobacter sp. 3J3 TaxID=2606600 RepID=UPI00135B5BD0|nr:DoxX family membrane protein [Dyadobacter sp. 3J3]